MAQRLQHFLHLSSFSVCAARVYPSQTLTFLHLDNAHVAQSRLILLDATLIFFLSLTMYSYVRFRKLRYLYVSNLLQCAKVIADRPIEHSPLSGGAG